MSDCLATDIRRAIGVAVVALTPLAGGCVATVREARTADGRRFVVKAGAPGSGLATEGFMLRYLAAHSRLPVPAVVHADDRLLVMEYIEAGDPIDGDAEIDAADHLVALHAISNERFGFERDTVIGGLSQPNPWSADWRAFFRDRRLLFMGRGAMAAGRLPDSLFTRLERLAGRLDRWIDAPPPGLIHGDVWSGNVLVRRGRVAAFVDPAIYFADPEIEIAFVGLFHTFGRRFLDRYAERRPFRPGFHEARADLYRLYPLLVHVRLFGGHYVAAVEHTLKRFGV